MDTDAGGGGGGGAGVRVGVGNFVNEVFFHGQKVSEHTLKEQTVSF